MLGIDAAWTLNNPSGVALVTETENGWKLLALASSYENFYMFENKSHECVDRPEGSEINVELLIQKTESLVGDKPDLVAIDMPIAYSKIIARRTSDNLVSKDFAARKCGTHSPTPIRPGPISDRLSASFNRAGYPILTELNKSPGIIEVYPHPALLHLMSEKERLPYKRDKIITYWPQLTAQERKEKLLGQWSEIIKALDKQIHGVADAMPLPDTTDPRWKHKSFEDMLDSIICAWAGIFYLNGNITPYGDEESVIWIPS